MLIRILANISVTQAGTVSTELLFFTLMLSATSSRDVQEISTALPNSTGLTALRNILFLGAVTPALMYGTLLYGDIVGPNSLVFQGNVAKFAIGLAVVFFTVSGLTQFVISRIEGVK